MNKPTLLPCPFCGAEPLEQAIEPHKHKFSGMPDHPGSHVIECGCGAGLIDQTRDAVVARWNRRAALEKFGQEEAEPVAWMYQHDETARTTFVSGWQLENGWETNNPRWLRVCALYDAPQPDRVAEDIERMDRSLVIEKTMHAETAKERDTLAEEVERLRKALEYTTAVGEAGQRYYDRFTLAHPLPVQFRWAELFDVLHEAALAARADVARQYCGACGLPNVGEADEQTCRCADVSKTPDLSGIERECCGTFHGTPHRSTCANYRGRAEMKS